MTDEATLIISDDERLVAELGKPLEQELGCGILNYHQHESVGDAQAFVSAAVFLDLRNSASAEGLLNTWSVWNQRRERSVPLIGICESGFSPPVAALADQVLSAFLRLPFSAAEIPDLLREATEVAIEQRHVENLKLGVINGAASPLLKTHSPSMLPVVEQLRVAAGHDLTVLMEGETGTGKTSLARLIHELSTRRHERFLTVACGGLPNELIDSELFGHVKGAFTGADKTKIGKFEAAEGGTVLLDEIDCVGMHQQAKLLRILETGEFEPLGSNNTRVAKARIIVASNVRLEKLIDDNQFRADLYYRLNQVKLELPPLRQRAADIVTMAMQFLEEFCQQNQVDVQAVDTDVLRALKSYAWPGNIRELQNEIRRAVLLCKKGILTAKHLAPAILARQGRRPQEFAQSTTRLASDLAMTERDAIEEMLRAQKNNRTATARALGISRVTLYNKLRKYKISIDDSVA
jgi:DNA-binding NtrC family response regulator